MENPEQIISPQKLSEALIDKEIPGSLPKKLFDGGGLFILILPSGSKFWRLKYRFASREKLLSFGRYPEVSLNEARNCRDEVRKLLRQGIDPSAMRKAEKERIKARASQEVELAISVSNRGRRFILRRGETVLSLKTEEAETLFTLLKRILAR